MSSIITVDIGSVSPLAWLIVLVVLIYIHSTINWQTRSHGRQFPPGPRRWPVVGNAFNVPRFKPWIGYRNLCQLYGDIVFVKSLGQSTLVLGSPEVINEYLDKRSSITSDRQQTPLIELTGCDFNFGLFPYGQRWRHHRRMFWQYFTSKAVTRYQGVQQAMAYKFLLRLLKDPAAFKEHIRHDFSSVMLKIIYDIETADKGDPYISNVDAALEAVSQGLVQGKFLAEWVPAILNLPSWCPGAGSKKLFARWRTASMTLKDMPFAHVQNTESSGNHSVVRDLLASLEYAGVSGSELKDEEETIKNVGAVALEGGADTTFSILQAVFVAMSLYPEVLKKAQTELDSVVGPTRLPDFSDEPRLVYVNAIIKEALRWHNVIPLCVPHCSLEDDEFHGFFIPKGTVILPNIWACMHDTQTYEKPEEFRPERFIRDGKLDASVLDPVKFVFGFGRRICPGRHFALASLFINVASLLHTFDITLPLDENGRPVKVVPGMTDGLLSYPEDVRCTVRPRSPWAESLILRRVGGSDPYENKQTRR
ncbi:cytochrome P450 [Lentinus tigrinus ALCF2SS1-7]|uniref:cytochrome P450 n=1 Tax=Lentinus tigrinus ALCF2SS1-7 TaxID=1328758 RepID=UPI0011660879|nr:cytochrome P450 [Lentinus tigrinus ALCF2SS1-7]